MKNYIVLTFSIMAVALALLGRPLSGLVCLAAAWVLKKEL